MEDNHMPAEITAVLMPAGTYFVGDPCYAVPDDRWHEWLALADPDVFGPNPTRNDGGCARVLNAELDGHPVLGIGTAYGDGVYQDKQGNSFPVDAGLIGLVSVGLIEDKVRDDLGVIWTFERPFECSYRDGVIVLGDFEINTEDEEEDTCYICGDVDDGNCSCYDEDDAEEDDDL
jgi:hypothetical protein